MKILILILSFQGILGGGTNVIVTQYCQPSDRSTFVSEVRPDKPNKPPADNGISDCRSGIEPALRDIFMRESGCNLQAVNPKTGACGLGQRYKCPYTGEQLKDYFYQIRDIEQYIQKRYGSAEKAQEHLFEEGWY